MATHGTSASPVTRSTLVFSILNRHGAAEARREPKHRLQLNDSNV